MLHIQNNLFTTFTSEKFELFSMFYPFQECMNLYLRWSLLMWFYILGRLVKNRSKYLVQNLAKLYRNDALCMSIQLCSLREMKPNKIDTKVLCCSRKYKFNMPPYQILIIKLIFIVNWKYYDANKQIISY